MKKSVLILILGVLLFKTGVAQERYEDGPAQLLAKIPFIQLTGGVVIIRGVFNDIPDTLNFVLDTGSGAISLDSSTVEEFRIPNFPSGKTVSGIAGIRAVNYIPNSSLHLPGLTVDSMDFYINNYDILTSVYGLKIDGVIGYSFLSRYIVSLNYDSMYMKVYTNGTFQYPKGMTFLRPAFTALPFHHMVARDERSVSLNGYLDTGAGLCFLVTNQFLEDSAFLKKKRKPVNIKVQGLGGKKEMQVTIVKQLQLGPFKFRRVPTNILDDEFNALSYPFLGGLIGNDILRRFNIVLNYRDKIFALKPNSHFGDPFDYSYTGMNLYLENGDIYIDDVVKDSPADKSGLKDRDILLAVNNDFTGSITSYKNLMQEPGDMVSLIVSRDGQLKKIILRIGAIR
ncbi:MAG: aspartyl protease family protein [Chitinophagaceae bacterium]|nr:aspartyl protease family protein [Chitinophagaceae bacterium]